MRTITLSLPYTLNEKHWAAVDEVYRSMDGWIGYGSVDGMPQWYGSESEGRFITASVEPSGLQIDGCLPPAEWTGWISVLCSRLSLVLGMEIHDADY